MRVDRRHGGDHGVDSADIATPADPVVAFLSPAFSPGVLHNPERLLLQAYGRVASWTVPNQQHTVVQVLPAYVGARDAANVCLHEDRIDANCTNDPEEKNKNKERKKKPVVITMVFVMVADENDQSGLPNCHANIIKMR